MSNENIVSHRDAKIAELREDIAALDAKRQKLEQQIAKLERESADAAKIEQLAPGTEVTYVYGRAANKRIKNGVVRIVGKTEKGVVQLKVETGEGFDAEFHLIDSSALILNDEDFALAQAEIDKAVAEAQAAAAEKAKGAQS